VKYTKRELKLVDDIVGLAKKLRAVKKAKAKKVKAHEVWGSGY
jgi:uncharacterized coiled-coil DUF342 family protein